MIDWQERVVTERNELMDKIAKLANFLAADMAEPKLEDRPRWLLEQQLGVMQSYLAILDERVSLF